MALFGSIQCDLMRDNVMVTGHKESWKKWGKTCVVELLVRKNKLIFFFYILRNIFHSLPEFGKPPLKKNLLLLRFEILRHLATHLNFKPVQEKIWNIPQCFPQFTRIPYSLTRFTGVVFTSTFELSNSVTSKFALVLNRSLVRGMVHFGLRIIDVVLKNDAKSKVSLSIPINSVKLSSRGSNLVRA